MELLIAAVSFVLGGLCTAWVLLLASIANRQAAAARPDERKRP